MFLFCCVLYISSLLGVMSQIQLTQPSSEIKKPGESVKIPCKTSGYTFTSYYISWVQQVPGKGLKWVGRVNPNAGADYSPSFKERFTISTDNAITTAYLQINSLNLDDTATYYCARQLGGGGYAYFDIWGQGTTVTVTSAQPSAPSVFPLLPCFSSASSQSEVTIGCLSTGYLPDQIAVEWNGGKVTSGIKNFPSVLEKSGGYLSSSHLTISTSDWKNKQYECNVTYKPTGKKITVNIPAWTDSITTNPPKVEVMQSSCGESGSVDLVCLINGYNPKDINIQWLMNGQRTSISPSNSTPYKDHDGNFGSSSRVSVPKEDWNAGDVYTCSVDHPASSTKNEDTIGKCKETGTHPKVALFPPTPKDLLITQEPKVTCVVAQMISPSSLNIKWIRSDGKRPLSFTSEPEQGYDGLYTVKSNLKISLSDWNSDMSFTCTVQHDELPSLIEKILQKRDEPGRDPEVYVYGPHPEELSKKDFVTLTCLIKGLKPKFAYVQWLKNDIVQDEDYYVTSEPIQQEDDDTVSIYSKLTIEKSDWNRGAKYTCNCVHKKITSGVLKKNREYIIWDCNSEDDEDSLWSTAATFITLFLISVFYSATITIVKVKWFISRILQFDKHDEHFITVLDSVTQEGH